MKRSRLHIPVFSVITIMPLIFSMLLGLSSTVIAKTKATATAGSGATSAQDLLPAEDVFKVSARFKDAKTIELTYQIADGYYLYRKRFSVANETPQFKVGKLVSPAGRVKQDATFGRVETYRKSVRVLLPITSSDKDKGSGSAAGVAGAATTTSSTHADTGNSTVKLKITSQGCADVGVCYPPLQHDLTLLFGSGDLVMLSSTSGIGATPIAQTLSSSDRSRPALPVSPSVADLIKKTP